MGEGEARKASDRLWRWRLQAAGMGLCLVALAAAARGLPGLLGGGGGGGWWPEFPPCLPSTRPPCRRPDGRLQVFGEGRGVHDVTGT